MKGELVNFTTPDKLKLFGFLVGGKGKKCYVHIHSWIGNFYENGFLELTAQAVQAKNWAFFTFTNRGMGMITDIPKVDGGYERIGGCLEKFEDCVIDIKAALEFLKAQGYNQFVLQGHSLGCQKAIYYQFKTQDPTVKGLVLLGPVDDPATAKWILGGKYKEALDVGRSLDPEAGVPDWMEFYPGLTARKFIDISDPKALPAHLLDYSSGLKELKIVKVPVLAVFGEKGDYQKNAAQALEFLAKEIKCATKLFPGADHWLTGYETELANTISEWLEKL